MRILKALMMVGILMLSFMVMLGCVMDEAGEDNGEPVSGAPIEKDDEGTYPLKTSLEVKEENGELHFQMKLINIGQEDIELLFGSGQQYEIVITDEAENEVYRYSDGKMFTLALVMKTMAAGEELSWLEVINYEEEGLVASEQYMVEVEILAQSEELELNEDDLRISQVLYVSAVGGEQDSAQDVDADPAGRTEEEHSSSSEARDQLMDDGDVSSAVERELYENDAFRNVAVSGEQGRYMVRGEARVFEATVSYAVSDGHFYVAEGFTTASDGAPEWGTFDIQIVIPQEHWPVNGTLSLELFEGNAKDGKVQHILNIPLESFK